MCLLKQAKEVHIVLDAGFFAVLIQNAVDLYGVVVTKGGEILVGTVEVICAEGDATVGVTVVLVVAENFVGRHFKFVSVRIRNRDGQILGWYDFVIVAKLASPGHG